MTLTRTHIQAFATLLRSHATLVRQIDQDLAAAGKVPLEVYDLLLELEDAEGERLTMRELALRSVMSPSGITRLVDRMAKKEFVCRQSNPLDGRSTHAVLCPAGKKAREDAWPVLQESLRKFFAVQFTESEAEALRSLLARCTPKG